MIRGCTDLIYPPSCILCHQRITPDAQPCQICLPCQALFAPNYPPFCRCCSRHLSDPSIPYCRACQHRVFDFDAAWAACDYNTVMRRAIHLFKYGQKTALRHYFTELSRSFLQTCDIDLTGYDMLCPIPLSAVRMRERSFNQSALLAKALSRLLKIPFTDRILVRTRNTKNQARLSPKDRWTNIQRAFKIRNSSHIKGRNILIIDDLFTTGATASEAARVLKKAGAGHVAVLTLAIAEFI